VVNGQDDTIRRLLIIGPERVNSCRSPRASGSTASFAIRVLAVLAGRQPEVADTHLQADLAVGDRRLYTTRGTPLPVTLAAVGKPGVAVAGCGVAVEILDRSIAGDAGQAKLHAVAADRRSGRAGAPGSLDSRETVRGPHPAGPLPRRHGPRASFGDRSRAH
jgi:hypothetical protein